MALYQLLLRYYLFASKYSLKIGHYISNNFFHMLQVMLLLLILNTSIALIFFLILQTIMSTSTAGYKSQRAIVGPASRVKGSLSPASSTRRTCTCATREQTPLSCVLLLRLLPHIQLNQVLYYVYNVFNAHIFILRVI